MSFFRFWDLLLRHPRDFFAHHFQGGSSPYFFFVMFTFGAGEAVHRLEKQFQRAERQGNLEALEQLNSWPNYWLTVLVGCLVIGAMFYYVGGWFYVSV